MEFNGVDWDVYLIIAPTIKPKFKEKFQTISIMHNHPSFSSIYHGKIILDRSLMAPGKCDTMPH